MDWSRIPSLNSLRAFSVVGETNSVSNAAGQLNVTPAAVRQQIRALESHLGIPLAVRQGRGVRLTPEGAALARELDEAFRAIGRSVDRLTDADVSRPVQVTTSPAFAVEWLMPRIAEFQMQNPSITLMLNPTADLVELEPRGIDVAIRYRNRERLERLERNVAAVLVSDMVVVGAPALVGERPADDLATLMDMPWLQELNTNEVADWFQRRGIAIDRPLFISQMPGNLIMQAVRRGDGITYTARAFFQDDIDAGRMTVLHSEPASGVYSIVVNPGPSRPALRKFLAWLRSRSEIAIGP